MFQKPRFRESDKAKLFAEIFSDTSHNSLRASHSSSGVSRGFQTLVYRFGHPN